MITRIESPFLTQMYTRVFRQTKMK